MAAEGYSLFAGGGDENVLELGSDDGCTTLWIYPPKKNTNTELHTLNGWNVWYMNWMVCELCLINLLHFKTERTKKGGRERKQAAVGTKRKRRVERVESPEQYSGFRLIPVLCEQLMKSMNMLTFLKPLHESLWFLGIALGSVWLFS